jgi:hypothetical protein
MMSALPNSFISSKVKNNIGANANEKMTTEIFNASKKVNRLA